MDMKLYQINYADGTHKIVEAYSTLEVVKKYNLCTRENINTKVIELENVSLNPGEYRPELDNHFEDN